MRTVRWGAGLGVVAAAFLLAAACGDDDKDDGNTNNQDTSTGVDPDPLNLEIQSVTIPDGENVRPLVRFRVTDGQGNPLNLEAEIGAANATPTVSFPNTVPRFTLAQLDDRGNYTSYYASTVQAATLDPANLPVSETPPTPGPATQATAQPNYSAASPTNRNPVPWPTTDPNDPSSVNLRALGNGVYEFRMPATQVTGLDRTKTHTLAGWTVRQVTSLDTDVAYASFNFVPSGSAPVQTWDVVSDQACNRCHGRLQAHGTRRGTQLCITCHSPQTTDPETSRTVDFKVMIHKIHMGGDLPSVKQGNPYYIVGFRSSIVDFSEIAFPFHDGVQHCTVCHQGGARSDNWRTAPSVQACTSCHDNVQFQPTSGLTSCATAPANLAFENCAHTGGPIAANPTDTQQCLGCHQPGTPLGVDAFHHGGR